MNNGQIDEGIVAVKKCKTVHCDEILENQYIDYCSRNICQLARGLFAVLETQTKDKDRLEREVHFKLREDADTEDDEEMIKASNKKRKLKKIIPSQTAEPFVKSKNSIAQESPAISGENSSSNAKAEVQTPMVPHDVHEDTQASVPSALIIPEVSQNTPSNTTVQSSSPGASTFIPFQIPRKKRRVVEDFDFQIPKRNRDDIRHGELKFNGNPFRAQAIEEQQSPHSLDQDKNQSPKEAHRKIYQRNAVESTARTEKQDYYSASSREILDNAPKESASSMDSMNTSSKSIPIRVNVPSLLRTDPSTAMARSDSAPRRVSFANMFIQPATVNLKRVYEPQSILRFPDHTPRSSPPHSASAPLQKNSSSSERKISYQDYKNSRNVIDSINVEKSTREVREKPRDPRKRDSLVVVPRHQSESINATAPPNAITHRPVDPRRRKIYENSTTISGSNELDTLEAPVKRPKIDSLETPEHSSPSASPPPPPSHDVDECMDVPFVVEEPSRYAARPTAPTSVDETNATESVHPNAGTYVDDNVDVIVDEEDDDDTSDVLAPVDADLSTTFDIMWLFAERLYQLVVNLKPPITKRFDKFEYFKDVVDEINSISDCQTKINIKIRKKRGMNIITMHIGDYRWMILRMRGSLETPLRIFLTGIFNQSQAWHSIVRNFNFGGYSTLEKILIKSNYYQLRGDSEDEHVKVLENGSVLYRLCIFQLQVGSAEHVDRGKAKLACYVDAYEKLKELCSKIEFVYKPIHSNGSHQVVTTSSTNEENTEISTLRNVNDISPSYIATIPPKQSIESEDEAPLVDTGVLSRPPDETDSDDEGDY